MPIRNIPELKRLRGLNEISEEERQKFLLDNADKLKAFKKPRLRNQAAEILYNNQKFTDYFGRDTFNSLNDGTEDSYNKRNELLRNETIGNAFVNTFKDDKDYRSLSKELDIQGMYDLLNSGYTGTQERAKRLQKGIQAAKGVVKDYDTAINNPYIDAIGAGFMQTGKVSAAMSPYQEDEELAKKDKEIREKLFAEVQERREAEVSDLSDMVYAGMIERDSNGKESLAESYNKFDELATKYSPHYATFKESKWMKDYSHEDRLKDYAKFQALAAKYGEGVAMQYLDRSMQNRVAEAQDGEITWNTLKGVGTTIWSDLGSNVALLANIKDFMSPERMGILNQGKNPDKPIYNERGEIVDYEQNDNWITNPAYWNDVYKYNTFSPTEIQAIKERGGISEDVNVRPYGYTPDFFSWNTAQEAFKQSGHIVAGVVETGLTGSLGKAVSWGAKGTLKAMGLSAKAMSRASKAGNLTNDLFVMATTGLEGSQLEAMGTFDEQMQAAREKTQQQIQHELRDYYNQIDYGSEESQQAIDAIFQQLKRQDKHRVAAVNNREGNTKAFPLSDEFLREQAKQQYTNQLLETEQHRLEDVHRKDELEAAKAAAKAYGVNFLMDYIKNVPITAGIQKFKIAKGSMTGALDNTIGKSIVSDLETGGVKRATDKAGNAIRRTSVKNVAKEIGKQFGGGFADEYLDGVNASFASGIGNNEFDNYIRKTYNPESYNAVVDGMLGNMLAGLSEGTAGLTDRENLYEGFIGMVAPVASVSVNPNIVFNPKDTWRAIIQGMDASGNQLSFAERLSGAVTNPLLDTYSRLQQEDRAIDQSIEAINKVVAANKDKLEDASRIISTLDDYSSPVIESRYRLSEEGDDNEMLSPSMLDSQDKKLENAFTLINALNTLQGIEGSSSSTLYQEALHTLDGLANGTLSEEEMSEEVDRFLAAPENKSILDKGSEAAREIAAERLQKNAQYFMEMQQRVNEIRDIFSKSPAMKDVDPRVQTILMQNLIAKDDYKKRLESLEEELWTAHTDTEQLFTPDFGARYGTQKSKENAVKARERVLKDLDKEKTEVQQQIDKVQNELNHIKEQLRLASGGDRWQELQQQKTKQEKLLASYQFQQQGIAEREAMVRDEKDAISSLDATTEQAFTEEYIMGLDARDRAEVLNPQNKQNYSKRQQKAIEHVRRKLQKDPEAMTKIRDAGILAQRIGDLDMVYSKISEENKLAADYLDVVESLRNQEAMAESLQRDIEQHYGDIEKAFAYYDESAKGNVVQSGEKQANTEPLKNAVLKTNSAVIKAYMEDHPEQVNAIEPFYDLLKFEEDAASVIAHSDNPAEIKKSLLVPLIAMNETVNNREEAQKYLENIIDSDTAPEAIKQQYESLLNDLTQLGYQRDATVIENRKQRKEREEAQRRAEEESRKKAEVPAKEVAKNAEGDAEKGKSVNGSNNNISSSQENQDDLMEGSIGVDLGDLGFEEESPSIESNTGNAGKTVQEEIKESVDSHLSKYNSLAPVDIIDIDSDVDLAKITGEDDISSVRKQLKESKLSAVYDTEHKRIYIFAQNLDGSNIEEALFHESLHRGLQQYYGDGLIEVAEAFWETEALINPDATKQHKKLISDVYKDNPETIKEEYLVHVLAHQMTTGSADNILKRLNPEHQEIINNILHNIKYDTAAETKQRKAQKGLASQSNSELQEVSLASDALGRGIVEAHDETLGDVIQGKSPTIEEQVEEAVEEGQDAVQIVDVIVDSNKENQRGEEEIETSPTTLNGNAMSEYEPEALKKHILTHKKGAKPTDNMNRYYDWMKNAGIRLQNIIDDELPQILADNPHIPIKFMRVRPEKNATNDMDMATHLMLVVEYNSKVAKIHQDENGGRIKSGDKEYLIVGTVGYGDKRKTPDKFNLWKLLMDDYAPNSQKLKVKAWDWFKRPENKHERFYVHPDFSTEIVPNSMIPGYLIKQDETDETEKSRSIGELLEDKERNPHGFTLDNLAWGIQTKTGFVRIKSKDKELMQPLDATDNLGRVFVLVPAGNGKLIPVKIDALKYNDSKFNKDGSLYKKVQDLLNQVISPNYKDRKEAITSLVQVLYFDPEKGGDNILVGADEHDNRVTVVHGNQRTTFNLDSSFSRDDFFTAIENMNPRINVTAKSLLNSELLNELEDAGALMTDAAKLGTSGVSYSIYGIDSEGKMIVPDRPKNITGDTDSGLREKGVRAFPYLHGETYKYNTETGKFTLNGVEVTDDDMINYAYRISIEGLTSVKQDGIWKYYIMSTGDNPEVVRQSSRTNAVERVGKEEAQRIIDDEIARIEEEKRRGALETVLTNQESAKKEDEGFAEAEDGSLDFFNFEGDNQENKEESQEDKEESSAQEPLIVGSAEGNIPKSTVQTFKQLWRSSNRQKLLGVLKQKDWKDIPFEDMSKLKKYLEEKGMADLDAIGTLDVDFQSWLHKLECL